MLVLMVVVTALPSHREINESVIVVELVLSKCQRRGLYFSFVYFPASYTAVLPPSLSASDERRIS